MYAYNTLEGFSRQESSAGHLGAFYHTEQNILNYAHSTIYMQAIHTPYTVHCTLQNAVQYSTLYIVHCTMQYSTVHCTLNTEQCSTVEFGPILPA